MLLLAGVFLPSAFFKKYVDLTAEIRPDNFERALQSDTVLMIADPDAHRRPHRRRDVADAVSRRDRLPGADTASGHAAADLRGEALRPRRGGRGRHPGHQRDHQRVVSVCLGWAARPLSAVCPGRRARPGGHRRQRVGGLGRHGPPGLVSAARASEVAPGCQFDDSRSGISWAPSRSPVRLSVAAGRDHAASDRDDGAWLAAAGLVLQPRALAFDGIGERRRACPHCRRRACRRGHAGRRSHVAGCTARPSGSPGSPERRGAAAHADSMCSPGLNGVSSSHPRHPRCSSSRSSACCAAGSIRSCCC